MMCTSFPLLPFDDTPGTASGEVGLRAHRIIQAMGKSEGAVGGRSDRYDFGFV